jgi:hypothetical protein
METKIKSSTARKQTGNFHPFQKASNLSIYLASIIIKVLVYMVIMPGIAVIQRLNGSNLFGQQLLHHYRSQTVSVDKLCLLSAALPKKKWDMKD